MNPFDYICHRRPDRSFHIGSHQFPVCARCTGLYMGMVIFLIINFIYSFKINIAFLILSVLLNVPCLIDGATQKIGLRESTNFLRFTTGLVAGFGGILFAFEIGYLLNI